MISLYIVAQDAMDAYYQGYAPRDGFFDIDDFKRYIVATYTSMLNAEFAQLKRQAKQEDGFSSVEISPDWLITEQLTIQRKVNDVWAELKQSIFAFPWDVYSMGLQEVRIVKCKNPNDAKAVKVTYKDAKFISQSLYNDTYYYYPKGCNKIIFRNRYPQEAEAMYVPALDINNDNSVISEAKAFEVITATCKFMVGIRDGQLIQMSNDSNPNKVAPKEIDTNKLPK